MPLNSAPQYSVHPGVLATRQWIGTLREKTGRSLEEWIRHLDQDGPRDEPARREWLKREHKLGTNTAGWLAERSVGKGLDSSEPEAYLETAARYVEEMYSGTKAGLRPVHDGLIALGVSLGKDVRVCPCKTIVPFYRKHVFAEIKPATRTRIDFGLALGDLKAKGRLVDTGGYAKKDRITHRIPIATPEEIDAAVARWLRVAYDRDQ